MEEQNLVKVYVRCNEARHILDVNSSTFLADPEGWVQIDEGEGDRYIHAQGNYFPSGCLDDLGVPLYRVVKGVAKPRPGKDIEADRAAAEATLEAARREAESISGAGAIAFVSLAITGQLDDVTISENASLFIEWDENWTGKKGDIVRDEGKLYRSIHDIGAGQNTKPSATPAMWTQIGDPGEEWPEWIQPLGAHDAYPAGAKVSHKNVHWVNTYGAGNTWEPGVFGWEEHG